jgi:nucleoside-diphosphate-sugar epimerase
MNVLVTGSGTLVGNTVSAKLARSHKVFASYNKNKPINLKINKNIEILKVDITKNIVLKKNFDALVHCASLVPEPYIKKSLFNKVNYLGFKKLLKVAKKKNCKKIILLSTMSVYGKISSKKITENEKFKKPDSYGQSKIKMENLLKKYCKNNNTSGLILRLPGLLGFKSKHNFLSNALSIIKNKKEIEINNPNLKYNNIVHVKNLAEIIDASLKKNIKLETYNLACKYPLKFRSIFELMFKKLQIKQNIKIKKKGGGFSIKLNKDLKKKYNLYTTKKALQTFINENLD